MRKGGFQIGTPLFSLVVLRPCLIRRFTYGRLKPPEKGVSRHALAREALLG